MVSDSRILHSTPKIGQAVWRRFLEEVKKYRVDGHSCMDNIIKYRFVEMFFYERYSIFFSSIIMS